jgi:hypothetical protein
LIFGGLLAIGLVLWPMVARGVILFGSGDPAYNTAPPTGALTGSGWQYEGQWGCCLGTPIAPHYFLAAQHIGGSAGQTFTYNGSNYTTTAYWDDPCSDLRLWMVSGTFPSYAQLYTNNDEQGKTLLVIGRGTQRGAAVMVTQTPTGSTNPVSTLAGWQDGPSDGVMRWGINQVGTAANWLLIAAFTGTQGPNEAFLSCGDSSGGIFIQDATGTWKLAGINYGIDVPFATSAGGAEFYGAIFNEDGLYVAGGDFAMPQDGTQRPAHFYASRVSAELAWVQSITGVVPPPPATTLGSVPPPQLSLQVTGGNVTLSYPTNAAAGSLQFSPGLGSSASWQTVTNLAAINGTNWSVTLPAAGVSGFFRLQIPN